MSDPGIELNLGSGVGGDILGLVMLNFDMRESSSLYAWLGGGYGT